MAEEIQHRMIGVADIPVFPQERGDPLGQPQLPVDFPEKKQPGVGRHLAPQEIRLDFFAPYVLEKQPLFAMVAMAVSLLVLKVALW